MILLKWHKLLILFKRVKSLLQKEIFSVLNYIKLSNNFHLIKKRSFDF